MSKKLKFKNGLLILIIVVAIIGLFWWGAAASKSKETQQTSREVALTCTTDMATEFHIHPFIRIVIDGEEVPIPSDIGVRPECMTSIHTHEGGGVIHVEAPIKKDFTLGDFFAVWDKPFSRTQIFDSVADEAAVITVSVNGKNVDTYEDTVMYDKDTIVIEYKRK